MSNPIDVDMEQLVLEISEENQNAPVHGIDLHHKVTKANALIEAKYNLSLNEQKIIMILASKVQPKDEDFNVVKFSVQDFRDVIDGNKGSGYHTYVRGLVTGLQTKTVSIKKGSKMMVANWLYTSFYEDNEGTVLMKFNPDLREFFLHIKEKYTSYELANIVKLGSSYSIRIYELLKQYESLKKRTFSIEEFKELLGMDQTKYPQYGHLKSRVILPAQKELKEKTDISFEFEEVKKGRKVVKLVFYIASDIEKAKGKQKDEEPILPPPTPPAHLSNEEKERDVLRKELISLQVAPKTVEKILKSYPLDRIRRNLDYVYDYKNNDKPIESIGGFTSTAIKDDYALNNPSNTGEEKSKKTRKPIRKELTPDWLEKQKQEEALKQQKKKPETDGYDLEKHCQLILDIKGSGEKAVNEVIDVLESYIDRQVSAGHDPMKAVKFKNNKLEELYKQIAESKIPAI